MPWLRQSVTSFSVCRPKFAHGSDHVGFVVDKVAMGQVFSQFFIFPSISVHRSFLYSYIRAGHTVGPMLAAGLTPSM
jgi:hypothetical protein